MKTTIAVTAVACCIGTAVIAEDYPYSLPFNSGNEFSQIGIK